MLKKYLVAIFYLLLQSNVFGHDSEAYKNILGVSDGFNIWNGEPANPQATYIVAISDETGERCTATRVSQDYFLTAAHCFKGSTQKPLLQLLRYNKDKVVEVDDVYINIVKHPNYKGHTGEHDIALFKVLSVRSKGVPDEDINYNEIFFRSLDEGVGIAKISYSKPTKFQPVWITGSGHTYPGNILNRRVDLYTWGVNGIYYFTNDGFSFRSGSIGDGVLQSSLVGDSGGGVWDKDGKLIGVMSGSTTLTEAHHIHPAPTISASLSMYKSWIEPIIVENRSNPTSISIYEKTSRNIIVTEPYTKCKYVHDHYSKWTCFDTEQKEVSRVKSISGLWDQGYADKNGYLDPNATVYASSNVKLSDWHKEFDYQKTLPSMSLLMQYCYENCELVVADSIEFERGLKELCFRPNCARETSWHYSTERLYGSQEKLNTMYKLKVCVEGFENVQNEIEEIVESGNHYNRFLAHEVTGNKFSNNSQILEIQQAANKEKKSFLGLILSIIL